MNKRVQFKVSLNNSLWIELSTKLWLQISSESDVSDLSLSIRTGIEHIMMRCKVNVSQELSNAT